jgi:hypothetical protein
VFKYFQSWKKCSHCDLGCNFFEDENKLMHGQKIIYNAGMFEVAIEDSNDKE